MNKREKSDNRKALPKFLLILLVSALIGGLLGFATAYAGDNGTAQPVLDMLHKAVVAFTPYSVWVITAVLGAAALLLYRQAKAIYSVWDGEDEPVVERADEKLTWAILLVSVNLVLDFFFFSLFHMLMEAPDHRFILLLVGFILSLAFLVVMQQKTVDLTRKMNPEKQGSIYDTHFQKTWLASCDENEQRQIGQAAYKAFQAVNTTCVVLFVLVIFLSFITPVGILPPLLIALIWGVAQVVYCLESLRLSRHN